MKHIRKRITYANVMSSIAVFLVLGGATAYAAKKIGSNQIKGNSITTGKIKKEAVSSAKIKKNAITTSKIKDLAITGAKVNLGTLGTVPSANTANTANNLTGFKTFSGSGTEDTITTLFSTGQFDVVGICDENGDFDPPGFPFENTGSVIGIINRGQNGGYADSSDDDDSVFNIGEGIAFDYLDAGDAGSAVLPNGHSIFAFGGVITESTENPNFGTGCTFRGFAFFN